MFKLKLSIDLCIYLSCICAYQTYNAHARSNFPPKFPPKWFWLRNWGFRLKDESLQCDNYRTLTNIQKELQRLKTNQEDSKYILSHCPFKGKRCLGSLLFLNIKPCLRPFFCSLFRTRVWDVKSAQVSHLYLFLYFIVFIASLHQGLHVSDALCVCV